MIIDAEVINTALKALLVIGLSAGLLFLSIHMLIRKLEADQVKDAYPRRP